MIVQNAPASDDDSDAEAASDAQPDPAAWPARPPIDAPWLTAQPSAKYVWALAWPVIGQNILGMLVGWSDMILTGRILSEGKYIAAVTVSGYCIWLLLSLAALVHTGSQAIVARLLGAGDLRAAGHVTLQSLLFVCLLSIGVCVGMWFGADTLTGLLVSSVPDSTGESPAQLAALYLRIVCFGAPAMMFLEVGITCLRAAGYTFAGMWIWCLVNVVNVGVSWWATVGGGPMPAFGYPGIAIGTSVSYVAGGLVTLIVLFVGMPKLPLPREWPIPDLATFRRIVRIGFAGAVNSLSIVMMHLWFISIIGRLGEDAVAAHGVALRGESLSWLSAEAFAIAAATLVGQSLGANRPREASQYGWLALGLSVVTMSIMGAGFFTFAPEIFKIFTTDEGVIAAGVPVLRIVAFGMPPLAANIVLSGALRGAGDTKGPLFYNFLGLLGVRIPMAYLLTDPAYGDMGLTGAWIAMVLDLWVRGILATLLFLRGSWQQLQV